MSAVRYVALLMLLLCAGTSVTEAQQALTLEQMALLVRPGDTVTVIDTSGRQVKGRIQDLSATSLRLLGSDRQPVSFAASDISTVRQRRADPLGNGARNGFWSGAAFGVFAALIAISEDDSYLDYSWVAVPLAGGVYGGIGAAIGVGVDALIVRNQVIYARPASPRNVVTVSPIAAKRQRGLRVSVRF
jgi:hypothetical protein